jgi:hypothetical protein
VPAPSAGRAATPPVRRRPAGAGQPVASSPPASRAARARRRCRPPWTVERRRGVLPAPTGRHPPRGSRGGSG